MPAPNLVRPASAPLRSVRLGALDAIVDRRPDGTLYIRSRQPLEDYHDTIAEPLEHWARVAPDRVYLAQRDANGDWCKLTYAEVLGAVQRIGAALLRRGLSKDQPIVILSGNDIEHALLALASMYVGIPYAPISPAYSLMSSDFGKLRMIVELLTPGMVFAADGAAFGRAIDATVPDGVVLPTGAVNVDSSSWSDVERMTARSMTFSSSRMFPGQW